MRKQKSRLASAFLLGCCQLSALLAQRLGQRKQRQEPKLQQERKQLQLRKRQEQVLQLEQERQQELQQPFRRKQTGTEPIKRQRVQSISLYFLS